MSRKLAALEFIKRHYAARGGSPSYGEIARALGVTTKTVHGLVHALADDGRVILSNRPERKIDLPEPAAHLTVGDALALLRREGFTVLSDAMDTRREVTLEGLPLVPELDQYLGSEDGARRDVARKSS